MRYWQILLAALIAVGTIHARQPENVFIIIIDGMRHDEGWAREAAYLPHIWNDLRPQGAVLTSFWDRGWTATTGGHTTILSGTRQVLRNNGGSEQDIRSFDPLVYEYYRKHLGAAESACGVVVGKWGNVGAICDFSLEPSYGEPFQGFQLGDGATHDDTVSSRLLHEAMDSTFPRLVLLNLADVDSRGHGGIYEDYLAAIVRADSVIYELWKHVQGIPPYTNTFYKDRTVMIVTSDHGRNDDAHGSFFGHGEWDHGSRQLGLLAIGPGIATGRRIDGSGRDQIDIVPTIGAMLGFPTPFSEGSVMTELFADGFKPRPALPAEPAPLAANLSGNPGFSRDPDIARDRDGNLYLVWSDSTPGKWSVLFRKSTNDGSTWSVTRTLFDFPEPESVMWYARVAADDSVAVAAMSCGRHLNRVDSLDPAKLDTTFLWYPWLATSTDAGSTWSHSSLLDSNMGSYHAPVTVRNGRVAVAWWACGQFSWQSPRNGIFFNNRAPNSAWRPLPVEAAGQQSIAIDMADDGTNYHVLANGFRGEDFDLVYCRSTNGGDNWTRTWVADDPAGTPVYDCDPALAVDDSGLIHVFWARKENSGGTWQLMYGRRDTLTDVFDTVRLTASPAGAWQPHAAAKADTIALVWLDYRDGNPEVYYRFSTDRGLAWSTPERVTYTTALSHHPRVAPTARGFYCVWQDLSSGNWEIYGRALGTYRARDAAVLRVDTPSGTLDTLARVVPRSTFRNNGPLPATFTAHATLIDLVGGSPVYRDSQPVVDLEPGAQTTVAFPAWPGPHPVSNYAVRCSLAYPGDNDPTNDVAVSTFEIILPLPGWQEKEPVPAEPSGRPVKDGAWMTTELTAYGLRLAAGSPESEAVTSQPSAVSRLYVAKGYKSTDFYCYLPADDSWAALCTIPEEEDGRSKPPRRGCRGVSDGAGLIYMTKGNNTLGFWQYSIDGDSWHRLAPVPEGPEAKKVKYGNDVVHLSRNDTSLVYLLKGYRTEFYRYNAATGTWQALPSAPWYFKERYYEGSFLVYDGAASIYCHQAKYYDRTSPTPHHAMFRYDIRGDTWYETRLRGLPAYGLHRGRLRKKKSRDGAAGVWYDGSIYALKGGNSQQFFRYFPEGDSWKELDTVPGYGSTGKKKYVKLGGDLVTIGGGVFYALKGNKTLEFWRYVKPAGAQAQAGSGALAGRTASGEWRMAIAPNPIAASFATVRLSLPKAGPVAVTVFDVAGRSVLRQSAICNLRSAIVLDLRKVPAGVYFVRLDAGAYSATKKLVVKRP